MEGKENSLIIDASAFNKFFSEYQQRFIRFAASYVSDAAIAEDIVMESFMAAWENRSGLSRESFPPYTLTIVKNKCLNHLRSRLVRQRAMSDIAHHNERMLNNKISTLEACYPEEFFTAETRRMVNEAVAALPTKTREIFIRSRFDGQGYKEIASEMGITVKSVEFEISKAVKTLRVSLRNCAPAILLMLGL